jgi:uncharacterized surface protein with fasciclin (FAS1) repeats
MKKKLFIGVLASSLVALVIAAPVHAQTSTTMADTSTMSTTDMNSSMGSNMMATTDLSYGSTGEGVSWLQTFLVSKGYLMIPAGVSMGYFGPLTQAALIQFQTSESLPAHGYYGALTRASINAMMAMNTSSTMPTTTSMTMSTTTMPMTNTMPMTTSMTGSTTGQVGVMVGGALMVPNLDIVQNAVNASNVTTVVAAVKAAGLVPTLEGAGPFTVFAPDNNAFNKLPSGTVTSLLLPQNIAMLKDILTYHVVAGAYTSKSLYNGEVLTTVEGKTLTIGKTASGQISINGTAMVETPDIISSNGVTFVIDTVLMPPTN